MGDRGDGAHGQWGTWAMVTWAMGPMGNWHILAYNSINTGWILTKILLDIDINDFSTMASFKSYFRWILNSVCSLSLGALLAQIGESGGGAYFHTKCACTDSSGKYRKIFNKKISLTTRKWRKIQIFKFKLLSALIR